jgi:4-alpha-glucanotransferase
MVAVSAAGPTGYGNSPYQPLSSFAGNELPIRRMGWSGLRAGDCADPFCATMIGYGAVIRFKRRVLTASMDQLPSACVGTCSLLITGSARRTGTGLFEYALFRALKAHMTMPFI